MTINIDHAIELEEEGLSDDFGKLIKEYRLMRGYSLADLEKLTNVSQSYISRIERNERSEVSFSKALRICYYLGIPYELMISKSFGSMKKVEKKKGIQSLTEIIFQNDFTVQGKEVIQTDVKEILDGVLKLVFDCPWDSKTKIYDLYQISKKVEKLKGLLEI